MRKYAFLSTVALCVAMPVSHADHHFIVKYKLPQQHLTANLNAQIRSLGLVAKKTKPIAGGAVEVTFTEREGFQLVDEQRLLEQLNKQSDVEYAVINRQGHFKPLPTMPVQATQLDLNHQLQWDEFSAPQGIGLESAAGKLDGAWAYSLGNAHREVVVAVLDTGIEQHPDLIDSMFMDQNGKPYGWNFAGGNKNLADETGHYHGTHVAGTIAGYGQVMQGVGPKMKILPVKIPAANGMFYESNVINAIYWAAGAEVPYVPKNKHKARVINMSFGIDEYPDKEATYCDRALQEAVDYARRNGVVVVAAAGNDNRWENFNAPAICSGVIRVASTGPTGLRSYFSNYGPSVTFAAPGGDLSHGMKGGILSTVKPGTGYQNSGYSFYQGTSMASPHVAGLFGLVDSASPRKLSTQALEQIVYATTHDFGKSSNIEQSCKGKIPCGHGIVDALNAVSAVSKGLTHFIIPSEAVKNGDPAWKRVDNIGKVKTLMQARPLMQTRQGEVFAKMNGTYYQFKPASHRHCEIVGFDGIGCTE